jgi:ABC-type glycerol-3-phosphate transport system substrate-binding protein
VVRRSRFFIAIGIAVGLAVSACGSSGSSVASSGDANAVANQITLWTTSQNFFSYQTSQLSAFTKATGIKVTVDSTPQSTILDKTLIAQRAHSNSFALYEGPTSLISQDIQVMGGVPLKPLVGNTKLTPSSFDLSDFSELGTCSLNGTLYCLPMFVDGAILAYNTKLFKQAGISSPPQTWEQVLADANAITTKTGVPGFCTRGSEAGAAIATFHFGESYFIPYSAQNKGFMVGPNWNSLLDTSGAVQWATIFQDLMTKDAPKGVGAFDSADCLNALDQGKTAMDWEGIVTYTNDQINPPSGSPLYNSVGFTALNCPTSAPCMPLGPWGMFINPNASKAQQNAAWKLMQWLDSPSFMTQEITALDEPGLAVRNSVAGETFKNVPSDFLNATRYVADHGEPNAFPPTTVFDQSQQDEEIAISELISGTSPSSAMSFAAQGQNSVFQQAGLG